ncbi:endonuclease [Capsulimonas corticalis]|uniref:Endonuclease n=1 Tax=Capsulimonas corticalis TaxID=2219043 RepID=A0A402D584_9BACT|nr:S1/P1 nuclease [Capsulimonas corticalis]BDI29867.1 endonuclease [Capsulimonas corticalis]
MPRRISIAVLFLMLAAPAAHAWDANGHKQIADIAWTKMDKATKAKVRQILIAGDPAYRPAGTDDESVRDAFRRAAIFADDIKRSHDTQYEPIIDPMNRTWLPTPDPADREQERCKTWHYYDTPIRGGANAPQPRASNALNALTRAQSELTAQQKSDHPDLQAQCWWLYWTEHIVGDLHQPLHCSSDFEHSPTGDAGGNGFLLGVSDPGRPGRNENLHFYWDSGIDHAVAADPSTAPDYPGPDGRPNYEDVTRRWSADRSARPSKADSRRLDVAAWISDGARLADTQVYTVAEGAVPSPEYDAAQVKLCKRLALLAGARLAEMLKQALR